MHTFYFENNPICTTYASAEAYTRFIVKFLTCNLGDSLFSEMGSFHGCFRLILLGQS